jgi:hypothetical protein
MVRDNHLPKSDFDLLKDRMIKQASANETRELHMQ